MDYVAVTEADVPQTYDDLADGEDFWNPRILFAIANTGQGYVLNLLNEHAVRSSDEGGVWGDPWEPLTSDVESFTVNAYGGSNWRWSEASTYKYLNGKWVLTQFSNNTYFSGEDRGSESNDYEAGMGTRILINACGDVFEYTVKLDEPPVLENHATDSQPLDQPPVAYSVRDIIETKDVDITGINVPLPPIDSLARGVRLITDQYIIYQFGADKAPYLAVYRKDQEIIYVVDHLALSDHAKAQGKFEDVEIYRGRIFYSREYEIYDRPHSRNIVELISVNPEDSDCKVLFKHEEPHDRDYMYLDFSFELGGGEAVVYVYGLQPQTYYRVNLTSGAKELLGEYFNAIFEDDCSYDEDDDDY